MSPLPRILLVDDDESALSGYEKLLRTGFDPVLAFSGEEGLEKVANEGPFLVVVSDYLMPGMDGITFLNRVSQTAPAAVRILLTGQTDFKIAIQAVNDGRIFRFLTKPCPGEELTKALVAAIAQYRLERAEKELLEKTFRGTIRVLMEVLSLVNPQAFGRATRLAGLARRVGARISKEKALDIELAAMFSQLGCVTLPSTLLEKRFTGHTLEPEEMAAFQKHPAVGGKLLAGIPRLEAIAEALPYQFKNYDGAGLPNDGKKGGNIPYLGRVLKVLTDYDELLQQGREPADALARMKKSKLAYDPVIIGALEAETLQASAGMTVRKVRIAELAPGMILVEPIFDMHRVMLINRNTEITELLHQRLMSIAAVRRILEPVRALCPAEEKPASDSPVNHGAPGGASPGTMKTNSPKPSVSRPQRR